MTNMTILFLPSFDPKVGSTVIRVCATALHIHYTNKARKNQGCTSTYPKFALIPSLKTFISSQTPSQFAARREWIIPSLIRGNERGAQVWNSLAMGPTRPAQVIKKTIQRIPLRCIMRWDEITEINPRNGARCSRIISSRSGFRGGVMLKPEYYTIKLFIVAGVIKFQRQLGQ